MTKEEIAKEPEPVRIAVALIAAMFKTIKLSSEHGKRACEIVIDYVDGKQK